MRESVNYDVRRVSTELALQDLELATYGQYVRGVFVRDLNVTAEVQIRLGRNGPLITLRQGEGMDATLGPPITAGVFLTAPAGGVGASAEILLVFDDQEGEQRGPAFRFIQA